MNDVSGTAQGAHRLRAEEPVGVGDETDAQPLL